MADLVVDVDGLSSITTALHEVAHGLDGARSAIEHSRRDLGSGDVYSALDHFEDHWDDGRGQIKKNMDAVTKALDTAVQQYRQADAGLTAALKQDTVTRTNVGAE